MDETKMYLISYIFSIFYEYITIPSISPRITVYSRLVIHPHLQVVSLRSGDLTQEEYDQLRSEGKLDNLLEEGEGDVQGPKTREEGKASYSSKKIFE